MASTAHAQSSRSRNWSADGPLKGSHKRLRRSARRAAAPRREQARRRARAHSRALHLSARLDGAHVPEIVLQSARYGPIDLVSLTRRAAIIYLYPGGVAQRTEARDNAQARSFRDHYPQLLVRGYHVIGVHGQSAGHQLHHMMDGVQHILAADPELRLAAALRLPTYIDAGARVYRPLTLVVERTRIVHTFYPAVAPALSGPQLLRWIEDFRPLGALTR